MPALILRRADGHRLGGPWASDDDDLMDGGRDVGRIFLDANEWWFWGVDFMITHYGTAESREAAMVAFKAEYQRWLGHACAAFLLIIRGTRGG